MECKEFSKYIGDYVNRTLSPEKMRPVQAHIDTCACCAARVKELEAVSAMVRSLNRINAPTGFEDRLKARIAVEQMSKTKTGYLHRLQAAVGRVIFGSVTGHRTALRPALAGMACALAVSGIIFVGHNQQTSKPAVDWAYINTMQEQHDAFAAANPLADSSAMMLKERAKDLDGEL